MTQAAELLTYLRSAGFEVTSQGERLYVQPRERLSPAEVEQVTALKPMLLNLVVVERMVACEACRAGVDPAASAEVGRLCHHGGCPYRRAGR